MATFPTRDRQVDKLTLDQAVESQGYTLHDPKQWATRMKVVRKGKREVFKGSHLDIWKWLFLITSGARDKP